MLRIADLAKSYGDHPVLQSVSLEADAGQIVGLAGPNGAGKTTMLKCILGVVHADAGTITVDGVDARAAPLAARRVVGYAPSETALYHGLRAVELLDLAIGFHPAGSPTRGRALLDALEVPPRRRVRNLSHGMKRKVLLAQVLASGSPMLILDEPLEAFDPDARRVAIDLLREAAASGHGILCASHDLASTQVLCDRVAFLSGGLILREGPTGELMAEAGRLVHVVLREERTVDALPAHPGWTWTGTGRAWTLVHGDDPEVAIARLTNLPIASLRSGGASLDEVFAALFRQRNDEP